MTMPMLDRLYDLVFHDNCDSLDFQTWCVGFLRCPHLGDAGLEPLGDLLCVAKWKICKRRQQSHFLLFCWANQHDLRSYHEKTIQIREVCRGVGLGD